MNYFFLVYFFVGIVVIRFSLNLNKFFFLKKALNKQDKFVRANFPGATEDEITIGNKSGQWIESHLVDIKKTVSGASVKDIVHTFVEPIGYGHLQQKSISVLDNLLFKNIDFFTGGRDLMSRAKGFYIVESFKSFNPLFWVEVIIFLPKHLINYFNSEKESKSVSAITKVIQIIYWIVSLIFLYLNYINSLQK